ncbi:MULTISPECIES: hypothetical protein [unclassified Bartonella]|uniref:hypothetical protein n=1 Tax=unclassified Bartonella TaxID=2645622 RepID=UPI0035CEC7CA
MEIIIVIGGILIAANMIYHISKVGEKGWNVGFENTILLIIIIDVFLYFEFSVNILLIIATLLSFRGYLRMNDYEEQFELLQEQKDREIEIYKEQITKWDRSLLKKAQKISQKWIKQWNKEIRQWEKDILRIKDPIMIGEDYEHHHPIIKDICTQGYKEIPFLYKKALETEPSAEHCEKINVFKKHIAFKKSYLKTMRLMKKNGIVVEKIVDPLTEKTCHKPTMFLLHWWLYVVDDMIIAEYEKQALHGFYKDDKSLDIYWDEMSKNTEYEEIEEILKSWHLPPKYECLVGIKKYLLTLLYDISDDYRIAREIFIHYKRLLETVTEGYISLDEDRYTEEVKWKVNECKEKDKELINEKDNYNLYISENIPTFEKTYKLGTIEQIKSASKKCYNRFIYWDMLVNIINSREKLQIIFGEEKVNALKKAIKEEYKQFHIEKQEAIFENKDFHYNKSYEHLVEYLL